MKFNTLVASLLNEMDVERLAKQDPREAYEDELDKKEAYKSSLLRQDEAPINDDFIDMIKSMPTDQLKGLFREDLHAYYELIQGSASEDRAQDRITMIGNELLSRGITSDELAAIRDEAKQATEKHHDEEYEHRGWPGDGSGEDDFADYNQMEGNDY